MEPGLCRGERFEVRNREGVLTDSFEDEHFNIGFDTPDGWASVHSAIQVTIADRVYWLPANTLASLKGKTLALIRRYDGPKRVGMVQNVLVCV